MITPNMVSDLSHKSLNCLLSDMTELLADLVFHKLTQVWVFCHVWIAWLVWSISSELKVGILRTSCLGISPSSIWLHSSTTCSSSSSDRAHITCLLQVSSGSSSQTFTGRFLVLSRLCSQGFCQLSLSFSFRLCMVSLWRITCRFLGRLINGKSLVVLSGVSYP